MCIVPSGELQADGESPGYVPSAIDYFGLGLKIQQRIAHDDLSTRTPMAICNEAGSVFADVRDYHGVADRGLICRRKRRRHIGRHTPRRSLD
jgi:hypothetical protein